MLENYSSSLTEIDLNISLVSSHIGTTKPNPKYFVLNE